MSKVSKPKTTKKSKNTKEETSTSISSMIEETSADLKSISPSVSIASIEQPVVETLYKVPTVRQDTNMTKRLLPSNLLLELNKLTEKVEALEKELLELKVKK